MNHDESCDHYLEIHIYPIHGTQITTTRQHLELHKRENLIFHATSLYSIVNSASIHADNEHSHFSD